MVCAAGWYVLKISLRVKKIVKDPLETRLWKPKSPRAGSSSAVVSMSAINCLLKVKQRLSTRCKELYCPLIKHSVHAAVMWSFFWQTWRLFKVFCRTILAMVRNFPWIIHLTAGDAAVKNSSLGRKEIKMGREKNNNKPRKWGKWKEFEWKKHVQRKCAKECAQEKQHFSAFSLQFFSFCKLYTFRGGEAKSNLCSSISDCTFLTRSITLRICECLGRWWCLQISLQQKEHWAIWLLFNQKGNKIPDSI